jgi:hypothetical protein
MEEVLKNIRSRKQTVNDNIEKTQKDLNNVLRMENELRDFIAQSIGAYKALDELEKSLLETKAPEEVPKEVSVEPGNVIPLESK